MDVIEINEILTNCGLQYKNSQNYTGTIQHLRYDITKVIPQNNLLFASNEISIILSNQ